MMMLQFIPIYLTITYYNFVLIQHCPRQPQGTNLCGFYVAEFVRICSHRSKKEEDEVRLYICATQYISVYYIKTYIYVLILFLYPGLKTERFMKGVTVEKYHFPAMQESIAEFINDHILTSGAEFYDDPSEPWLPEPQDKIYEEGQEEGEENQAANGAEKNA
jgi:hypothetical protein